MVLDEPNASLELAERMLSQAIERMKAADTTATIITHRIGVLAATDKIAIMQGGTHLAAFGDSKEICERYLARPRGASIAAFGSRTRAQR